MKNLLFVAALSLMASPAFAQSSGHTATVDQVGSSNSGTIDQSGVDHHAMIDQQGTNTSTITQAGTRSGEGNEARTLQINSAGEAANEATIEQDGDDLNAAGSEAGDLLDAALGGFGSEYYTPIAPGIVQVGSGNTGRITQTGSWNSAAQVVIGQGNEADIDQSGASNITAVGVLGASNTVDIDQSNRDQGAVNNLAAVAVAGVGNYMKVDQSGQRNDALFGEVGFGPVAQSELYNSTVDITQSGSDNQVVGYAVGNGNDIDVTQSGEGNSIGGFDRWSLSGFGAGIEVLGDGNTVRVTQSSDGNTAMVNVFGNGNTSNITQN